MWKICSVNFSWTEICFLGKIEYWIQIMCFANSAEFMTLKQTQITCDFKYISNTMEQKSYCFHRTWKYNSWFGNRKIHNFIRVFFILRWRRTTTTTAKVSIKFLLDDLEAYSSQLEDIGRTKFFSNNFIPWLVYLLPLSL